MLACSQMLEITVILYVGDTGVQSTGPAHCTGANGLGTTEVLCTKWPLDRCASSIRLLIRDYKQSLPLILLR